MFCMSPLQTDPKLVDDFIKDLKDILEVMKKDTDMATDGLVSC